MGEPVPESTLPYPPIYKDKKFVVLSDWDGTITTCDSNDYMTDNLGYGKDKRRQGNLDILSGRATFRDAFREMLESISANGHTFEECKEVLRQNISLDAGFKAFYAWCKANDIPVIIVSSGMTPTIRAVLSNLVGEDDAKDIDIISNDVDIHADGTWRIKFRHPTRYVSSRRLRALMRRATRQAPRARWALLPPTTHDAWLILSYASRSGYGHDKSHAILPYRDLPDPPVLFFFGDGVSDMSAARHADVLFVKEKPGGDNDLAAYCRREGIKHVLFDDFAAALPVVQAVVEGKKTTAEVLDAGKA
ncbi:hypothetical protein HGRIS_011892 [Hohenbuehelia grisea]|uniref:Phosphatase n=1 Tax=Hohenbuehelia grisea TaxID=104357 RepID=A0ABR3JXG9_9AGAR